VTGATASPCINMQVGRCRYQVLLCSHCTGVHVVIDPVGGQLFNEALKSIAWGGHIAVIGFAAGGIPKVSLHQCDPPSYHAWRVVCEKAACLMCDM
jgi:NADPH2:quinone reductase